MDDNYLDEVLPRWKFWKECLIEQLEKYAASFEGEHFLYDLSDEETEKIKKINAEMIEKIKEIKSRTDFEKITDGIVTWNENIKDICSWKDYDYAGVFWEDVTNEYKLSSWLNIENLARVICHEANKEIMK